MRFHLIWSSYILATPNFQYKYNNVEHLYFPDFIVYDRYVEIKGKQFFDKNGNLINPFDKSQNGLYKAKQECMVNNNVCVITECKKYIDYVNEKYGNDFIDKTKTK